MDIALGLRRLLIFLLVIATIIGHKCRLRFFVSLLVGNLIHLFKMLFLLSEKERSDKDNRKEGDKKRKEKQNVLELRFWLSVSYCGLNLPFFMTLGFIGYPSIQWAKHNSIRTDFLNNTGKDSSILQLHLHWLTHVLLAHTRNVLVHSSFTLLLHEFYFSLSYVENLVEGKVFNHSLIK
jgi:hypothetical protein